MHVDNESMCSHKHISNYPFLYYEDPAVTLQLQANIEISSKTLGGNEDGAKKAGKGSGECISHDNLNQTYHNHI